MLNNYVIFNYPLYEPILFKVAFFFASQQLMYFASVFFGKRGVFFIHTKHAVYIYDANLKEF